MWHQLFIWILFLFYFSNGQVGQSFGPRPVYVDSSNSQQGKIIKIKNNIYIRGQIMYMSILR